MLFNDSKEVLAIVIPGERFGQPGELLGVDEAHPIGDLLGAGNLRTLATFNRLDEFRSLQKRVVRSGIEPGKSASENLD